jgi:hypothetical protein
MAKILALRTCNADGTSYNGFKWPESGHVVCTDWNSKPVCGGGLHGLKWGHGKWSLLFRDGKEKWQVFECEEKWVDIDKEKGKCPECDLIYTGDMATAVTLVLCNAEAMKDCAETSSGDYSTAASSGNSTISMVAGFSGRAMAGKNGCFALAWHDGKRPRIAVGYVGENGIEADTWYKCDDNGKLIKA